jgi:hypothetical protein
MPMRRAFHIAVVLLLGYLIADRAATHFQAGAPGTITCAHGAELVALDAMRKGFSEAGSTSQGEAFMSTCLVSGRARVGDLIARD